MGSAELGGAPVGSLELRGAWCTHKTIRGLHSDSRIHARIARRRLSSNLALTVSSIARSRRKLKLFVAVSVVAVVVVAEAVVVAVAMVVAVLLVLVLAVVIAFAAVVGIVIDFGDSADTRS